MILTAIRSPKRRTRKIISRANWFPYYADFSVEFVEDIVSHLELTPGSTLLDPWLGAGTTAQIGAANGLYVRGYDLNPAMVIVSRARVLPTTAKGRISTLLESITRSYEVKVKERRLSQLSYDPLQQWLQPKSVGKFRILQETINLSFNRSTHTSFWQRTKGISPLFAFFYVGLFRTLRYFLFDFKSSNPTWIKVADHEERLTLRSDQIIDRFCREMRLLLSSLFDETRVMPTVDNERCIIDCASSLDLPLPSESIDAVVSSPPYCTRIDYVKATLPELAMIGYPNGPVTRSLRDKMIGTPTITKLEGRDRERWGSTCARFLSAVENHSSKASSTYYLKYYIQYFSSVFASLVEINRVLKNSARCVLVVQDSYYKEVKNDLPQMIIEMGLALGWSMKDKKPFRIKQTLAGLNPDVKAYRRTFRATEFVLVFSK
jgi:hypothetical protein